MRHSRTQQQQGQSVARVAGARALLLGLAALLQCVRPSSAAAVAALLSTSAQYQPFVNGVGGWRDYRIPSMLHLANGDLLLFCEARGPDHGPWASLAWTQDGGPTDVVQSASRHTKCPQRARRGEMTCRRW